MAVSAEASVTLSLIDRITGPIKAISARIAAVTKSLGVDRITGAVGRLGRSLRGLGDGLAASTSRLSAFLGVLGVGGAGAIASAYGLAKSAADVGAELTEMSGKLGINIEALQEYRFAAKMSGIEVAAFDKGVEKLGINSVEAVKGNKQLAAAFKTLGVRVKGTKGEMRATDDILDDTMLALSRIQDPLKRNQLAFKVFGKSGVELVKMLGDGSEGLRDLREEARRTGNVMSKDAAAAGDELGDRIDALMERVTGLKNLVGVQLIPVFNEAVKGITDWADANATLIRSTVTEWAQELTGFIKALIDPTSELRQQIDGLGESFTSFVNRIRPVVDFVGGPLYAALGLIAAFILGPAIAALMNLTAAVFNLGIVILSTPIGWILAGLAALAGAGYVLYQKWDEFLAYWVGLWDRVKEAFAAGFIQGIATLLIEFNPVTHIMRGMNAVFEYFTGINLAQYGSAMIRTLADGIDSGTLPLAQMITGGVSAAWAAYENWWNSFSASVRAAGAEIVNALWEGLKSAWGNVVEWMKGAVADLVGWLPESIQKRLGFTVNAEVEDNASESAPSGENNPRRPGDGPGGPGGGRMASPVVNVSPSPADVSAPVINLVPKISVGAELATTKDVAAIGAAVNDNIRSVGASIGALGGRLIKSVPAGASDPQGSTTAANDNGQSTGSGDIENTVLTNSSNTVNTTLNATVTITAPPGADAAAIGAAVRRELDTVNRRAAAANQSALSD